MEPPVVKDSNFFAKVDVPTSPHFVYNLWSVVKSLNTFNQNHRVMELSPKTMPSRLKSTHKQHHFQFTIFQLTSMAPHPMSLLVVGGIIWEVAVFIVFFVFVFFDVFLVAKWCWCPWNSLRTPPQKKKWRHTFSWNSGSANTRDSSSFNLVKPKIIQLQCTSRSFFLTRSCDRSRRSARCFGIPDFQGPEFTGVVHIRCVPRSWYPYQVTSSLTKGNICSGIRHDERLWVGGRKRSKTMLQVRYTHNRRFTLELHSERDSPN